MKLIATSPEEQLKKLKNGADEIIGESELLEKLSKSYESQTPLTIKLGADPSRPDLHLGHTIVLKKLRLLQEYGHIVKFIIGDFTAQIGDPTGKNKTRPQLGRKEIESNCETYKQQVFKVLDPSKTDVVYNSTWLNKIDPISFIGLLASRTVQQLLARDDFSKRYSEQVPIFLHELVYPIMQAYDSFELKADVEIGGTDQKFNLLLGREFQRQNAQRPQSLILLPLLEGTDGVQKMSKSLNNYIGLNEKPQDMFGKTMSISDALMLRYFELLVCNDQEDLETLKFDLKNESLHPMEAKKRLAEHIVKDYWGPVEAKNAREYFDTMFSKKSLPDDIKTYRTKADENGLVNLLDLSMSLGFCSSKSEVRRILKQNGIRIDDEVQTMEKIALTPNQEYILRQGKRKIVKLIVT